jgi:hypothetical protein
VILLLDDRSDRTVDHLEAANGTDLSDRLVPYLTREARIDVRPAR